MVTLAEPGNILELSSCPFRRQLRDDDDADTKDAVKKKGEAIFPCVLREKRKEAELRRSPVFS